MNPSTAIELILEEYHSAVRRYPKFHSPHEGYAILLEELDELWEEVRRSPSRYDPVAVRAEAIQVAAMALRFLTDCVDG